MNHNFVVKISNKFFNCICVSMIMHALGRMNSSCTGADCRHGILFPMKENVDRIL